MELDRLTAFASDPKRTRAELEQMKANAIANGNVEAANAVNEVLLRRLPVQAKAGGGKTPTEVSFRRRREAFDSGKEGYLWVIEQFRVYRPAVLDEYLKLHRRRRNPARGSRFAKTSAELVPNGAKRADDPRYYAKLTGGWFADTNIKHDEKFAALLTLSHLAGLEHPSDWEFGPIGSTERLRQHQEAVIRARELVAKLFRALETVRPNRAVNTDLHRRRRALASWPPVTLVRWA